MGQYDMCNYLVYNTNCYGPSIQVNSVTGTTGTIHIYHYTADERTARMTSLTADMQYYPNPAGNTLNDLSAICAIDGYCSGPVFESAPE